MITDPKLQFYTASPDVVARSLFTVKVEREERKIFFLPSGEFKNIVHL